MRKIHYLFLSKNVVMYFIASFFILFTLTILLSLVVLFLLSKYRYKHKKINKNIQFIDKLVIKTRLKRFKEMIKNNANYYKIFGIWLNRYDVIIKRDLDGFLNDYLNFLNKKNYFHYFPKQMKKLLLRSTDIKNKLKLLSDEIDYFTNVDEIQREYQLFFKQNFNHLKTEFAKIKLHTEINIEQVNKVIDIIETMFVDLSTLSDNGDFHNIIIKLGEIAIGIITLAEILNNLPNLNHIINAIIPEKIKNIYIKLQTDQKQNSLYFQFENFKLQIQKQIKISQQLIQNLQYKKARNQVQHCMLEISVFEKKAQNEQEQQRIFDHFYDKAILISDNFLNVYEKINEGLKKYHHKFNNVQNEKEQLQLRNKIQKKIITFNHQRDKLLLELSQKIKVIPYSQLLQNFRDLLDKGLHIFKELEILNKNFLELVRPILILDKTLNQINSMTIQIDNILAQTANQFLAQKYLSHLNEIKQKIIFLKMNLSENMKQETSQKILHIINETQNKIFQLYENIRIEIYMGQLSQEFLIYNNRYRPLNAQLIPLFTKIEHNIKQKQYNVALATLMTLIDNRVSKAR